MLVTSITGLYLAWDGASSNIKTLVLLSIDLVMHGKNDDYLVQGELGGVSVAMPRPGIFPLEYDDEKFYKENRKAVPHDRTRAYKDKVASFGFEVRFPDMELETIEVKKRENGKSTIHNTVWMHVGIASNSHLAGGELGLERLAQAIPQTFGLRSPEFQYQRQTELVHGLIAYYPVQRVLSQEGVVSWKRLEENSLYYHLDGNGKVDTYIQCAYVKYGSSPCQQLFLLLPKMLTMANVYYRNGLLPHWQEIQSSVSKVVLGFAVAPSSNQTPR